MGEMDDQAPPSDGFYPLVGWYFTVMKTKKYADGIDYLSGHAVGNDGEMFLYASQQGQVRQRISKDLFLVDFFSFLDSTYTHSEIRPLREMRAWYFYSSNQSMLDWFDRHYRKPKEEDSFSKRNNLRRKAIMYRQLITLLQRRANNLQIKP